MSEEKSFPGYCRVLDRRVVTVEWDGRSFWTQTAATEPASTKALAKLARPLPPYWKRNQDKQYTGATAYRYAVAPGV